MTFPLTCRYCRQPFAARRPHARYCGSECRRFGRRKQQAEYQRINRDALRPYKTQWQRDVRELFPDVRDAEKRKARERRRAAREERQCPSQPSS